MGRILKQVSFPVRSGAQILGISISFDSECCTESGQSMALLHRNSPLLKNKYM